MTGRGSVAAGLQRSLPAKLYTSPEVFDREKERIFSGAWQIVCHLSDLQETGAYQTLEILGEQIATVRGADGVVRSFHNVCRHRASRLLDGPAGRCGPRITCPYHAWTYGLDGALRSIPPWQGFTGVDRAALGLKTVEQEIWRGFVFVRLEPGGPAVAEMMSPYADELAAYRLEELKPRGAPVLRPRDANWKNIADNYGDALHIPVAHPGLSRLFEGSYTVEASRFVDRMSGTVTETPSTNWSERLYQRLLPTFDHLAPDARRAWRYYRLWPNTAFDVYPDQVDFMQLIPVSATRTLIREIAYALPDPRREVRIARYLNWRINRQVNLEDTALIQRIQIGMSSSGYEDGPLSPAEPCLASFAARVRAALPEHGQADGDAQDGHDPGPGHRPDGDPDLEPGAAGAGPG